MLTYYPRRSQEVEVHHYLGGMMSFGERFPSRIHRWLEQLTEGVAPEDLDAKGEDALKAQKIIEAAITSWETESAVELQEPRCERAGAPGGSKTLATPRKLELSCR